MRSDLSALAVQWRAEARVKREEADALEARADDVAALLGMRKHLIATTPPVGSRWWFEIMRDGHWERADREPMEVRGQRPDGEVEMSLGSLPVQAFTVAGTTRGTGWFRCVSVDKEPNT